MTDAPALVRPIPCRRCSGRGFVDHMRLHAGAPGTCFTCTGEGVVEGDRATLAAQRAEREAAQEVLRRSGRAQQLLIAAGEQDAYRGLILLGEQEPARLPAAVDAVLASHPTVVAHLASYFLDRPELRRLRELSAARRAERLAASA